ncbi:MAG: hypothetical protein BWY14_00456 [Parcubacteria group bacterium ADurb.Bin192]|nr:MAG: hypothetical protein BWY14_00456 [Parcubacteria group bacterium ADurb.Bin192]
MLHAICYMLHATCYDAHIRKEALMRRRFILKLIANMTEDSHAPPPGRRQMIMRTNHGGPSVRHGKADSKQVRELVLSLRQHDLLQAGWITWTGLDMEPFVVTTAQGIEHEAD